MRHILALHYAHTSSADGAQKAEGRGIEGGGPQGRGGKGTYRRGRPGKASQLEREDTQPG